MVSTVLPNLLESVSPCRFFIHTIFIILLLILGIYFDHFPYYRICWPISADQSAAAVHLTENLNVGFELFQVRTGDGLKPIARRKGGLGVNNTPEGTREAVGVEMRQTII